MIRRKKLFRFVFVLMAINFVPVIASGDASNSPALEMGVVQKSIFQIQTLENLQTSLEELQGWAVRWCNDGDPRKVDCQNQFRLFSGAISQLNRKIARLPSGPAKDEIIAALGSAIEYSSVTPDNALTRLALAKKQINVVYLSKRAQQRLQTAATIHTVSPAAPNASNTATIQSKPVRKIRYVDELEKASQAKGSKHVRFVDEADKATEPKNTKRVRFVDELEKASKTKDSKHVRFVDEADIAIEPKDSKHVRFEEEADGNVSAKVSKKSKSKSKPEQTAESKSGDLTKAELSELFNDFSVSLEGEEPKDKVVTSGLVFDECNRFFKFKKEMQPEGESCRNAIGFRIVDETGEGRKCVRRLKEAKRTCDNTHCARFSQRPYTSIDLSGLKEDVLEVKLVFTDLTKDRDRNQCVDFGDKALVHRSQKKINEEANLAEEQKLKSRVQSLASSIGSCKDSNGLDTLRKENDTLLALNAITSELFDQNSSALDKKAEELRVAGLREVFTRIPTASAEELSVIREQLLSWASDYPQDLDHVVEAFRMVAHQYTAAGEMASSQDWDAAIASLNEAQSLSGLKKNVADLLVRDLKDAKFMQLNAMANEGNSPALRSALMKALPAAQREVQQKCMSRSVTMESCGPAMQNLQNLQSIPQRASEADMKNYQLRMQILTQVQQGSSPYNQMPGAAGGMYNSQAFMGGNPQMMGGYPNQMMGGFPGSPYPMMGGSPYGWM